LDCIIQPLLLLDFSETRRFWFKLFLTNPTSFRKKHEKHGSQKVAGTLLYKKIAGMSDSCWNLDRFETGGKITRIDKQVYGRQMGGVTANASV